MSTVSIFDGFGTIDGVFDDNAIFRNKGWSGCIWRLRQCNYDLFTTAGLYTRADTIAPATHRGLEMGVSMIFDSSNMM